MNTIFVTNANWTTELANAIKTAEDGDKIVVSSNDKKELAERALARMCPEKQITFVVDEVVLWGADAKQFIDIKG